VERAARMTPNPLTFMLNLAEYLKFHAEFPSELLHPTHKTREERQLSVKKRAAKRKKARGFGK
jgi:hypothetical protein